MRIYPSVLELLHDEAPGWDNPGLLAAMKKARAVVAWIERTGQLPGGGGGSSGTEEKSLANLLAGYRSFLRGKRQDKGHHIYPEVKVLLDEQVPGWHDPKLWNAMLRARELVEFVQLHDRLPTYHRPEADAAEKSISSWRTGYKKSLAHDTVTAFLDENLDFWR